MSVERYRYDKAGNMVKKALLRRGRADPAKPPTRADYAITTFAFDDANQLVSSTTDGVTTRYVYDAAGRLVKEGSKTYTYGYLDKVMSVTEGDKTYTYTYHADGQLASANYGGKTEGFLWVGLALVRRGDEHFVNEPHVGNAPKKLRFEGKPRAQRSARRARKGPRGNPVASSKGTSYFNDALGTTVGAKKDGKYSPAALSAFGEDISDSSSRSPFPVPSSPFFTGKPFVEGLGHAFLMRNYRAGLAKWQTADPMGYPDGWNQLAYCRNDVTSAVDLWGCETFCPGGEHESFWHQYKEAQYDVYTGGIYPPQNPNVPAPTDGEMVRQAIRSLNGLTVTFDEEESIYLQDWEYFTTLAEYSSGNYEYKTKQYLWWEVKRISHYAYYSKSNLLSSLSDGCTTVGAAVAIVSILFPELTIPVEVGTGVSVGGFLTWLGGKLTDKECKSLIFTEYKGLWKDRSKVVFLHRRVE